MTDASMYVDQRGLGHALPPGTKVEWRLSGYLLVRQKEDILLVKSSWRDVWELPGGGIDAAESLSTGTLREGFEETGYDLKLLSPEPFLVTEGKFYLLEENAFLHSVRFFFSAGLLSTERKPSSGYESGEITQIEWVSLVSLREDGCHPIHWPAIREWRRRILYASSV